MHNKVLKIFICVFLLVFLLCPCFAAFASSVASDWDNYIVVFNDYNESGSSSGNYMTYWVQRCDFTGGGGSTRGGGAGFYGDGHYGGNSYPSDAAYDLVTIEGKLSTIATMLINAKVTFLNHFSFYRACVDLWDRLEASTQAQLEAVYDNYLTNGVSAWTLDGEAYADWVSALTSYAESGISGVFFDRTALTEYKYSTSVTLYDGGYKATNLIGKWANSASGPWAYLVTPSTSSTNAYDFTVINTLTNTSYVIHGFFRLGSASNSYTDFSVVGPFKIVQNSHVQGEDGTWADFQFPFLALSVFLEYTDDTGYLHYEHALIRSHSGDFSIGDSAAFSSPSLTATWHDYGHFHQNYVVENSVVVSHTETYGYGDYSTESGVVEDISLFDAVLASNVFSASGAALNNSADNVEVYIPAETITDLESGSSGSYDYSTVPDASELPSEPVTPGPEYDPGDIENIVPGLDDAKNFMWHINAIVDFFKSGIDSALDYIKLWKSYFSDILADIGQFPQFLASMIGMIPPQLLRLFTLSILCIGGLWLFRKLRS